MIMSLSNRMELQKAQLILAIITMEFFRCGGLKFDVVRPMPSRHPDQCVKMNCSIKAGPTDSFTVVQVISLAIHQGNNKESEKLLAAISSFHKKAHSYEYPKLTVASGRLSSEGGNLNIELKRAKGNNCSSEVYSCELRFVSDKGKIEAMRTTKMPKVEADTMSPGTENLLSKNVVKDLKEFITGQVSKLVVKTESLLQHFNEVVENLDHRLAGLEDRLDKGIHEKLVAVEQKMTDMTVFDSNFKGLEEILNYTADTLENVKEQGKHISSIEAVMETQLTRINELESKYLIGFVAETVWLGLNDSISVGHASLRDDISTLAAKIDDKMTSIGNSSLHCSDSRYKRLITEAIMRLSRSIDNLQTGLRKTNNDTDSIENILGKKFKHMTMEITQRLDNFSQQLDQKLAQIEEKRTSASGRVPNSEMNDRLVNLEINLENIKFVMRDFKYLFGLTADLR